MAHFVVLLGFEPGRRIALTEPGISFGRTLENTVQFDHPLASRRHAEVRRDSVGWVLHDLNSLNGVLVNGARLQVHRLAHGDTVTLGGHTLRFDDAPALPAPAPLSQVVATTPAAQLALAQVQAHSAMPALVGIQGPLAGQRFALAHSTLALGRTPDNGVVLTNTLASRRHAELRYEGSQWMLFDLGGVNGTFVNGQRVQSCRLMQGDLVALGHELFRFEQPALPVPAPPPPAPAPPAPSHNPWAAPATSPVGQGQLSVQAAVQQIAVQCPSCKRRVPIAREDCPWCGAALVNGKTVW